MFYLLKSTFTKKGTLDVLIDKDQIEAIRCQKTIDEDGSFYAINVTMKSKDYWSALFNTEDEVREEFVNLGVLPHIAAKFTIFEKDEEREKKDRMKSVIEKILNA